MKKLPKKPSQLIRLALKDLETVEKMPGTYTVDMSIWHTPFRFTSGLCHVCLAGAVISQTLGGDPADYLEPSRFVRRGLFGLSTKTYDRLMALDSFRRGAIQEGLRALGYSKKIQKQCAGLNLLLRVYYADNAKVFKYNLLTLATQFEQKGL